MLSQINMKKLSVKVISSLLSVLILQTGYTTVMASEIPTEDISKSINGNMDYEIKNPYETVDWKTFGQYKADFHAHSKESDGADEPAAMIEEHYKRGYDILAMTDHNFTSTTWDRTDRQGRVYLTSKRLQEITTGSDRDGKGMTGIPTSNEQSRPDHLNTFWATFNNETGSTLESNIAKCQELGGISHINHPGRYTGGMDTGENGSLGEKASNDPKNVTKYVDLFTKYNSCVGMEIINKKDGDSYSDRILWDNILTQTMPQRPVWGFSNDDTHALANTGFSYNMMLMPENTLENVRKSMENGTFYAVAKVAKRELGSDFKATGETPLISDILVDQNENSITVKGEHYNVIEWIADGKVIATGSTIDLNDYEDSVSTYVRAQLKGNGGISFTQPFGIIEQKPQTTSIIIDSVHANPGKNVEVKIRLENIKDLGGLKTRITFDPTKIILTKVQMSSIFDNCALNTKVPGEIFLNALNAEGATNSNTDLGTLSFSVKASVKYPDNIPLTFEFMSACNSLGNDLDIETVNGNITVVEPVLPVVSEVTFTGECVVGQTLKVSYNYFDEKGRSESGTTFRWLVGNEKDEYVPLYGQSGPVLKVTKEMVGKYIKVEVTPSNSEDTGVPVSGHNKRNMVIRIGDVDKNGEVNFVDGLKALQFIKGKIVLDPQSIVAGDVVGNTGIDTDDVTKILDVDVGLSSI